MEKSEFVIFCEARTGSYHVVSKLASAPDIMCHGEIFKSNTIELSPYHAQRMQEKTPTERNAQPIAFIQKLRRLNPHKHFGFKLFYSHMMSIPTICEYLVRPNVKKVILQRSTLEVFTSLVRAKKTGEWVGGKEYSSRHVGKFAVKFTDNEFRHFLQFYHGFLAFSHVLSKTPNTFVLDYSQINDRDVIDALLQFIGSRATADALSSKITKQYVGDVKDAFKNWNDVERYLGSEPALLSPVKPTAHSSYGEGGRMQSEQSPTNKANSLRGDAGPLEGKPRLSDEIQPGSRPLQCKRRFRILSPFCRAGDIGAEIGVFKGAFVEYLLSTGPSKLFLVDPWYLSGPAWPWSKGNQSTIDALAEIFKAFRSEIEDGLVIPRIEYCQTFLNSLNDQSLDWVYIDTTHTYEDTLCELRLSSKKVKKGGFIMGDDYYFEEVTERSGVHRAVNEFIAEASLELVVAGDSGQFVVRN